MMRMLLGVAALTLTYFVCGATSAQPKDGVPPKGHLPASVTGLGESLESAKKDAVNKAVEKIAIAMELNDPPLRSFKATEKYVRDNLLVDNGKVGEDIRLDGFPNPFKAWVVTFKGDYPNWWKDIIRHDQNAERQYRAEHRQTLGSRIVVGLGMLLLAGFGYVRLDEFTQRRYTTLLRVAALGVVTSLAAGWWTWL